MLLWNASKTVFLMIVLLLLFNASPGLADHKKKELIFGVHPYLHATTLLERFSPLTEYLGSQMGYHIHIRVATSYQEHIDAIRQGKVDFAYIGPASYIKLTEAENVYKLLGRLSFSGKSTFRGAIIIRKDSPFTLLSQLQDKRFAFGDPNSTLSTLVPQRLLVNAGIELDELKNATHLKNHHNVALAVLMGKYDAGGIKEEVFNEYQSRGLKALQWTPDIPSHPFIATPKVPEKQFKQLRDLLQNLHLQTADTVNAKRILQKIKKGTTAIIPAHIEEYAELRKLLSFKPPTNIK
ncbi:MAG: phosphate/phosphite/phosphonate ABC transporter substrate-binding protein [Pseudomonadota bacterium]